MGTIRNIKLSDLLLLVAKLNCDHKVVDVVFDEEENALRFHPVELINRTNPPEDENPDKIEDLGSLL